MKLNIVDREGTELTYDENGNLTLLDGTPTDYTYDEIEWINDHNTKSIILSDEDIKRFGLDKDDNKFLWKDGLLTSVKDGGMIYDITIDEPISLVKATIRC